MRRRHQTGHITIRACWHGQLQRSASRFRLSVQDNTSVVATAKYHRVIGWHLERSNSVCSCRQTPPYHVSNRHPPMLAYPWLSTKAIQPTPAVHGLTWRTLVMRVEVVRAHYLRVAVRMRKHENVGKLIRVSVLVRSFASPRWVS